MSQLIQFIEYRLIISHIRYQTILSVNCFSFHKLYIVENFHQSKRIYTVRMFDIYADFLKGSKRVYRARHQFNNYFGNFLPSGNMIRILYP